MNTYIGVGPGSDPIVFAKVTDMDDGTIVTPIDLEIYPETPLPIQNALQRLQ